MKIVWKKDENFVTKFRSVFIKYKFSEQSIRMPMKIQIPKSSNKCSNCDQQNAHPNPDGCFLASQQTGSNYQTDDRSASPHRIIHRNVHSGQCE